MSKSVKSIRLTRSRNSQKDWQKDTKTGKAEKKAELYQMAKKKWKNNCHTPGLVQAFSNENGGLNQVLQHAKPPTYMTTSVD